MKTLLTLTLILLHGVSHSALLEVVKALRNDEPNFKFKPCSNCNGKGYAYGNGNGNGYGY